MQIKELIKELDVFAPLAFQESYDNSGFMLGDVNEEIQGVLITLDITETVVDEAIAKNCNLIISHHPFIFSGIKKIVEQNSNGHLLLKAIRHNISLYAMHTNLDNVLQGVNGILAKKLELENVQILQPKENLLTKLAVFCPVTHIQQVRQALFDTGAGHIGNYDYCSFNTSGKGTFRANEKANPFVGNIGELHEEEEQKIEVIYPNYLENKIIKSLLTAHPYEEVAYDLYPLANTCQTIGSGIIGTMKRPLDTTSFLKKAKEVLAIPCIRHSEINRSKIQKVAICGGSGSFLIQAAKNQGADIFLTGDLKYHDFQQADNRIILADVGHYESEQFAKELIYSFISEKFSNFALLISEYSTNYVAYF